MDKNHRYFINIANFIYKIIYFDLENIYFYYEMDKVILILDRIWERKGNDARFKKGC